MDTSTIIMLIVALLLLAWAFIKTPELAEKGVKSSVLLFLEISPRMFAAFLIAGLIQAVVPEELIADWMGQGSGMRGIFIGMAVGTFTPGGPMTHFPIIASFLKIGIGVGPLISYLTAWSILGLQRIIMWELPFLGPRVVVVRVVASFFFPLFAGWFSQLLWNKWTQWHP
jgi:uncharacterized membrane protein YraQ (UPF0718 family)